MKSTLLLISLISYNTNHTNDEYTVPPTVGPNSKVKGPLRRLGICLTYKWVSSKNSEIKYSTDGPLR